jgi:hypothetical protein
MLIWGSCCWRRCHRWRLCWCWSLALGSAACPFGHCFAQDDLVTVKAVVAELSIGRARVMELTEEIDPVTGKPCLEIYRPSPAVIWISGASVKRLKAAVGHPFCTDCAFDTDCGRAPCFPDRNQTRMNTGYLKVNLESRWSRLAQLVARYSTLPVDGGHDRGRTCTDCSIGS